MVRPADKFSLGTSPAVEVGETHAGGGDPGRVTRGAWFGVPGVLLCLLSWLLSPFGRSPPVLKLSNIILEPQSFLGPPRCVSQNPLPSPAGNVERDFGSRPRGGQIQHLDSGSGAQSAPPRRRPREFAGAQPRAVGGQASVDIPSITNTYAGGEDKTPPFSPEVDSPPALSSPFFPKQPGSLSLELPARLPTRCLPSPPRSLAAPGESGGAGRREGTNGVATPREKLGGKRGVGRKGQSTRLGAPHSLPPPPPFRTGRGEGGSGGSRADVTAGRARPRRRRWEPLRAQRSGARPGAPDPPLPCLPPAAVCHALAGAGAPGERRELGLSPGTRLIGAEEPLSPQPPHPRRCLAGARAPFLVRKCHCPLCLGEAGERGLGSEGGGFGQGSVRELGWTERGGWGIPARPPWAAQAAGASLCRWGGMRGALPLRVGGRTQSSRAKGCGAVGSAQR
nr:collagen alpha-1(I) chain-like [Chlorocebus sabaeus]